MPAIPFPPKLFISGLILAACYSHAFASEPPLVFPFPQEMHLSENRFALNNGTVLLLPLNPSKNDRALATILTAELSDRYGVALRSQRAARIPSGSRVILMGSISNPLVKEYCTRHALRISERDPGPEGYILHVDDGSVLVAGSDERGAFYGVQSLRQLIASGPTGTTFRGVRVRDWPYKPFRGIKLFLPGRDSVAYYKRFVRDFAALYKFNKLIIEVNAAMRLDRHPELNAGWIDFARDVNYNRRNHPEGPQGLRLNSSHHDTADGGVLEKQDVADLVRLAADNYIEVIPEIPALSHSFYLLTRHPELSEVAGEQWPDTYCPSNPGSYKLLFDVFDEYIEVMKPHMVQVGHDEWRMPIDLCPRCKGKDTGELFARDLAKIHAYLAAKGIKTAIWGDYLLESVRGRGPQNKSTPAGFAYRSPGGLTPSQVKALVPKDILIFNWFWGGEGEKNEGESNELRLREWGFRQVYGNFRPSIKDYGTRSARTGILGGAPSSWAATTEFNFGKDTIYEFLSCGNLLWSKHWPGLSELPGIVQSLMPGVQRRMSGRSEPSQEGDPAVPVDITASFNSTLREPSLDMDLTAMRTGSVAGGGAGFDLKPGAVIAGTEGAQKAALPRNAPVVKIGEDATSLIFLHASAKRATNKEAYRLIWDFEDSADLLGWYEVVYQDGFLQTIPIRYGVNILEWGGTGSSKNYCYGARPVDCGVTPAGPVTFFAFEWKNPRLGKVIREVRLKGTTGFRGAVSGFEDHFGPVISDNAVILKALSIVRSRRPTAATPDSP